MGGGGSEDGVSSLERDEIRIMERTRRSDGGKRSCSELYRDFNILLQCRPVDFGGKVSSLTLNPV